MPSTSRRSVVNGAVFTPVVVPGAWPTTAWTQEEEQHRKSKPGRSCGGREDPHTLGLQRRSPCRPAFTTVSGATSSQLVRLIHGNHERKISGCHTDAAAGSLSCCARKGSKNHAGVHSFGRLRCAIWANSASKRQVNGCLMTWGYLPIYRERPLIHTMLLTRITIIFLILQNAGNLKGGDKHDRRVDQRDHFLPRRRRHGMGHHDHDDAKSRRSWWIRSIAVE